MLDGMSENKKAVAVAETKMQQLVSLHQHDTQRHLNVMRTDVARQLALLSTHPPATLNTTGLPEASTPPGMSPGADVSAPNQDQDSYLIGHASQAQHHPAPAPASADEGNQQGRGVVEAARHAAVTHHAAVNGSVYAPSERASGSEETVMNGGVGGGVLLHLDAASGLVPRVGLKRCVSDDAVPASLRCAAIVVGRRLFLFPKGRDGMCDLQFAMVSLSHLLPITSPCFPFRLPTPAPFPCLAPLIPLALPS
jgi:hypothetical protein